MTLTNLLLRGVKSQFNADANRKKQELPFRSGTSFYTTILLCFCAWEVKCQIQEGGFNPPAGGDSILQTFPDQHRRNQCQNVFNHPDSKLIAV